MFATDSTGSKVWEASYLPFGGVETSTGPNAELRFPGQWFQSETGLHQNWMRDYDPTTGRYMQADPLGLVEGASVYGYVRQNPGRYIDPRGEQSTPGAGWPGPMGSGLLRDLLEPRPGMCPIDNITIDPDDPTLLLPPATACSNCSAFEAPEEPDRPNGGSNKCTLMYTEDALVETLCNYACEGPPEYWNVVHIPHGAQCRITYRD